MGRKAKHIEKADIKFIRANNECMTVSEIARKRKMPYSHVYNYMTREGIPMLTERSKRHKCEKKKPKKSKWFNPNNSKDWIL